MTPDLTVLVLTLNEEMHIERCIRSVTPIARRIVVVDSGSTDRTCAIAESLGADVLRHPFVNYAKQFNWGLDNADVRTTWVMRLDADEYLTDEGLRALPVHLTSAPADVAGFTLNLRRIFMGKWLRWGGLYPIRLLRVWRFGTGRCEERWMDEHILLNGKIRALEVDFADHNLNSLTWWTEKHNKYANREAADLLNLEYRLMPPNSVAAQNRNYQAGLKRWLKERLYAKLPGGVRALLYFSYRYFLRLGFLDGRAGTTFHVLQGFWYRYLVDAKVAEVKQYMKARPVSVEDAIRSVLGVNVSP